MRLIFTLFEILVSLLIIAFGIYTFYSGFAGSPSSSMVTLPTGAGLLGVGFLALFSAIRSRLWHRSMHRGDPVQRNGRVQG